MLVLTPKYGSLIDLDLLKKQKKEPYIKHRNDIIYLTHCCKNITEAYLTFLTNKDKYIIGYKPKDAEEIYKFVKKSLGEIDTLDVSWIDISDLDSLYACFAQCQAKHIVGLEKWDVSNVKYMGCMFYGCGKLESIDDISGWDVSKVQKTHLMFNGCKNLESIGDISGWDVSNVYNMSYMFNECLKLKAVGDLEQWNVQGNVSVDDMFFDSAIKPLPSWYHE